jgi:hypothetical protein
MSKKDYTYFPNPGQAIMPTFSESSDSLGGPHKQDHHNHIAQGNLLKNSGFRLRLHHPLSIPRPLFVCNFSSVTVPIYVTLKTSSDPPPAQINPLQQSASYVSPNLNNVILLQVNLACHEDTASNLKIVGFIWATS